MRYFLTIIIMLLAKQCFSQDNLLWYQADQTPVRSQPYIVPDQDSANCILWLIHEGESPSANDKLYLGQLIHELKGQRCPGVIYVDTPMDVWDSISIYYPMAMSSINAHKLNIKDTVNYIMSYVGSPTHTSYGVAFNGSSQWGNTNFSICCNISTNNNSIGIYINGGTLTGTGFPTVCGISDSLGGGTNNVGLNLEYKSSNGNVGYTGGGDICNSTGVASGGNTAIPVFQIGSSIPGFVFLSINGIIKYQNKYNGSTNCKLISTACQPTATVALASLHEGCLNHSGAGLINSCYMNLRCATFFVGRGLGPAQMKWLYDCMYTYNTTNLGR